MLASAHNSRQGAILREINEKNCFDIVNNTDLFYVHSGEIY